MEVMDELKSLGFDHIRHNTLEDFRNHWHSLEKQGLKWRLQQKVDLLADYSVMGDDIEDVDEDRIVVLFYQKFFLFWIDATTMLTEMEIFTFEDQKYFAYQDEQKNVENRRFLSGAAGYDYVFVDEFQDINPLDLSLVRAIVKRSRATLTIAGDDDQAIFEWRGATPEYILNPEQYFQTSLVTFALGVNYRSPANVVERSQLLIANNVRRVDKQVRPKSASNAEILILQSDGLLDAMEHVSKVVRASRSDGLSPGQIALVGVKKSQIIPYQVYFASNEIPFCAAEDLQLFLSATFERLLKLLKFKADAEGDLGSKRAVHAIVFFCDLVKKYRLNKSDRNALTAHLRLCRPTTITEGINALASYRGSLKGKNKDGQTSTSMVEAILSFLNSESVARALLELSSKFEGLHRDLGKAEEDVFFQDPPFDQLAEYAVRYGSDYATFVKDIEAAKETLVHTPPFEADETDDALWKHPLHLMTALRAKGKEFDNVILLDVQDGIWPHKNAITPAELEAQRRVFYVAFTRARQQVTMLLRKGEPPSPYIEELGLKP